MAALEPRRQLADHRAPPCKGRSTRRATAIWEKTCTHAASATATLAAATAFVAPECANAAASSRLRAPVEIAQTLTAPPPFTSASPEYRAISPLMCRRVADPRDDVAFECQASLQGSTRGALSSAYSLGIYHSAVDYEVADARVKAKVAATPGRWTVSFRGVFNRRNADGGLAETIPYRCYQSLGATNSPAYCTAQAAPQVFVVSVAAPSRTSTPTPARGASVDDDPAVTADRVRSTTLLTVLLLGIYERLN